jgi:mono-ADP-ribosyltransferase sirtuin 6
MEEAKETSEFWDSPELLHEKLGHVAQLLVAHKNKPRVVVFTGAGISTAAGIGNFRGIFGLWTEKDMKHAKSSIDADDWLTRVLPGW